MATFEVFVPVQGEFIVTVKANSKAEAIRLITDGEIDFVTEGEPNVEMVPDDAEGPAPAYATLLDDADDEPVALAEWERELLYPWKFTAHTDDYRGDTTYEMRHVREPEKWNGEHEGYGSCGVLNCTECV